MICCQSDPLQLSESWRNHYIWEVCSTNRWDVPKTVMPAAGIGQQKRPSSFPQHLTTHRTTNASKVELIGLQSFASCVTFTWPLPNWLPPLQATTTLQASRKLFVGKTPPQPAGGRRCFARDHWIPKHGYLLYRNKQTYFSLAKNGAHFEKTCFEPSYNDLKFMVWNHNYVCTNLIIRKEHNSCSYLCQYGRKGCLAVTRLESCTGGFWSWHGP